MPAYFGKQDEYSQHDGLYGGERLRFHWERKILPGSITRGVSSSRIASEEFNALNPKRDGIKLRRSRTRQL